MAVGSWQLAVGSAECWVLGAEGRKRVGSWQWAVGCLVSAECWVLREERELAVGSWQLAVGSGQLAVW